MRGSPSEKEQFLSSVNLHRHSGGWCCSCLCPACCFVGFARRLHPGLRPSRCMVHLGGHSGCRSMEQGGCAATGKVSFPSGPWPLPYHPAHRHDSLLDRHTRSYKLVQGGENAYQRHSRSEEHTSELQSLRHLVCRL